MLTRLKARKDIDNRRTQKGRMIVLNGQYGALGSQVPI